MKSRPLRETASTGRQSVVGQRRHDIYKGVWRQIKHAMESKCWLEAVTLAESIIADRLEARLARLAKQSADSRRVGTASAAARMILARYPDQAEKLVAECNATVKWSRDRNGALHEMAKLTEGEDKSWAARYDACEAVAIEGIRIARSLSKITEALNKE